MVVTIYIKGHPRNISSKFHVIFEFDQQILRRRFRRFLKKLYLLLACFFMDHNKIHNLSRGSPKELFVSNYFQMKPAVSCKEKVF